MPEDKDTPPPTMYGITSSNRKPKDCWGKNIFNNVFPMSLAMWLRDTKTETPFILSTGGKISCECRPHNMLLGLPDTATPHFEFEAPFREHSRLCQEKSERVDVLVCDGEDKTIEYRFLEIKLIVVPDSASSKYKPEYWAPEIVFRPSTSTNCALSIFRHLTEMNKKSEATDLLKPICRQIHSWGNPAEMHEATKKLLPILRQIITLTEPLQEPVIACTIWRTEGVSPILADNAFDIFAWTSTAFMHMLCDKADNNNRPGISRPQRSALRSCRILYELLTTGSVYLEKIITEMSFDKQDDKDFSISGIQTIKYMKHPRLLKPAIGRDCIDELVSPGGIENLSPERRLDATLYFDYKYATRR